MHITPEGGGQKCGSIEIENASVTVTNEGKEVCIGIGASDSQYGSETASFSITSISIKDSYIEATAKNGGACIGFGLKASDKMTGSIGEITISNTDLDLTAKSGSGAFLVGRGQMATPNNPPTGLKSKSRRWKRKLLPWLKTSIRNRWPCSLPTRESVLRWLPRSL